MMYEWQIMIEVGQLSVLKASRTKRKKKHKDYITIQKRIEIKSIKSNDSEHINNRQEIPTNNVTL